MSTTPPPAKRPRTAPAPAPASKIATVAERLAFWFSRANIRKSSFLGPCMRADASGGGWVSVGQLLTFNTLVDLCASATDIINAAATRPDLLETDRATDRVRLVGGLAALDAILDPALEHDEDERTLFLAPLPASVTRSQILAALHASTPVLFVSIPRVPETGLGKGYAFVEFATVDAARACAASVCERKGALVRRWSRITVVTRTAWKAAKAEKVAERHRPQGGTSTQHVMKDVRRRREMQQQEQVESDTNVGVVSECTFARRKCVSSTPQVRSTALAFEPGVVIRATGFSVPTTRAFLRNFFENVGGPVAFVDYRPSTPGTVCVRFMQASSASAAVAAAKRPLVVELLSVGEERVYWDEVKARSQEKRPRDGRHWDDRGLMARATLEHAVAPPAAATTAAPSFVQAVHIKFDDGSSDENNS
jgi:RNA binding motif/RNA recognition motif. (a.k.a. RRM, RBD, or RNP domain)